MRKILFSSFVASLYLSAASCVLATSEDPLPSMSSKSASTATGESSGEGSDDDNSPDIVVEYGKVRDTSVFPVDPMQRVADLLIDPVLARERVSAFKASLQNEEMDEASDLARDLEFFQAFYSLSNEEKTLERESYTRLLRRLVEQAQMDRPMSLSHQKALLCDVYHMGMVDIYETAANCYIAHPDFRASQGTDPLAGARAYGFLNQYTKSCILYQMAWKHQKTLFSMQDFYFFINAIQKEGLAKKAGLFSSSIADVCFEVLRRSEPYEDGDDRLPERTLLYCVDILAHLNCIADAKSVLKRYFNRQDDYIVNSHVAAANLYLESNEPEMAAYYWSNALAKGYKPVQRDIMSALESFLKNKDTKRALKLWEDYKASEEPKTPELLVHAAYHFKLASMDEKAIECVEQALELPQEKELDHHPCCTAAMIYSGAHLHHKAVRLWRMIRKTTQPFEARQAIYIPMVYSFAAVGDFKEASACIHELTQEALTNPLAHNHIQEMPIAQWAMHHLRAGEVDRANDFMKLYGHLLETTPVKSARGPRVSKRTREATMTDMMATLRQTLVQQTHEALRANVKEILTGDRNLSQELRAQVKEISQRAEELTKHVKGSSVPSRSVGGKSQTLSSASSSSSSSTASERDVGQDPLFQLQRLRDELTTLKVRFQRDREAAQLASRKKLMREELQIALQEEPGVFEGLSGPSLKMTVRQNAKDILDVQSAKKKKRAARRAASSASPSSSSSAASSPGPSTSTPVEVAPRGVSSSVRSHDVTFFMTSLAKKHLGVLKRMPGYEDKFDDFVEEVERNPWARKGHGEFFVGAHTKLLKGYDNVFSKRFASKERFLYRVEKGPDGKVYVTILSLLKHDL